MWVGPLIAAARGPSMALGGPHCVHVGYLHGNRNSTHCEFVQKQEEGICRAMYFGQKI